MRFTTGTRVAMAALALTLPVVACSAGDDDAVPSEDVGQAAEDLQEGVDDIAEDAEDVLADSDGFAAGTGAAEVTLLDTTMSFETEDDLGCFITEDGGSMGGLSFTGTSDDGSALSMDWAGDSPDASVVDIEPGPDGSPWLLPFTDGDIEVTIDGDVADVRATLVSMGGESAEAEMTATVTCG